MLKTLFMNEIERECTILAKTKNSSSFSSVPNSAYSQTDFTAQVAEMTKDLRHLQQPFTLGPKLSAASAGLGAADARAVPTQEPAGPPSSRDEEPGTELVMQNLFLCAYLIIF